MDHDLGYFYPFASRLPTRTPPHPCLVGCDRSNASDLQTPPRADGGHACSMNSTPHTAALLSWPSRFVLRSCMPSRGKKKFCMRLSQEPGALPVAPWKPIKRTTHLTSKNTLASKDLSWLKNENTLPSFPLDYSNGSAERALPVATARSGSVPGRPAGLFK